MRGLPLGMSALLAVAAAACVSANTGTTDDDAGVPDATSDSAPAAEAGMDGGAHDGTAEATVDAPADAPADSRADAPPGDGGVADAGCPPPPHDAGAYGNAVLVDNPLAYWRFDETAGPTAHDSSGHCMDGTYKGPVVYGATGALAKSTDTAITLNGGGAYVDMGDVLSFTNLAPFSLEMWVRPVLVNTEYRGLITKEYETPDMSDREGYVLFQMATAGTGFERYQSFVSEGSYCAPDGGAPDAGGCSESGSWVHLVATFDGGNMNLYQNGVLVAGPTFSPQMIQPTPGCSLVVGALLCGSTGYFSGDIDEVAVYGTALSPARVNAHYVAASQ